MSLLHNWIYAVITEHDNKWHQLWYVYMCLCQWTLLCVYTEKYPVKNCVWFLCAQCAPALPPAPGSQHFFSIVEGRIDPHAADFCAFKESYCLSWSTLLEALWQLEWLLCQFAVPHALVCGDRLVALAQSGELQWGRHECLLSALENREEVLELMKQPGQRYKGEGGRRVAAVRIQACWRCYRTRTAYLHQKRHKWAVRTIAISWLMHAQLSRVRKSLQATRLRHLENYHNRAKVRVINAH